MTTALIIFGILFSVFLAIIVLYAKNLTLDRLEYGQDEKIVYEEYPVRVKDAYRSRSTTYPNSRVIITNYRIILAQKILLSKKFTINFLINFGDTSGLSVQARKGIYRIYEVSRNDISAEQADKGLRISIPIRKDIYPHTITFSIKDKSLAIAQEGGGRQ
jgi:hypothetical protein